MRPGQSIASPDERADATVVSQLQHGTLMPIGGAEQKDPDSGQEILERFVALAGGEKARIVVIPTASEEPGDAGQRYVDVFTRLGAADVQVLMVDSREDANAPGVDALFEGATGVFITGGAQERLVSLLVGTRVMDLICERNADGAVVGGTSAGASILTGHLLVGGTGQGGNSGDAAARKGMVELSVGFGLLHDLIIDQHFSQRGRLGRLLSAFAANPGLVGIGLDEDTAVVIDEQDQLEVLGSGMVTIVDGREATSNYFDRDDGDVLSVVSSSLHVLGPGGRFDLASRQPLTLPQ